MSKITKAAIIAGLTTFFFVSGSDARKMCHDTTCSTAVTHSFGYISPGFTWVDNDNLNNFLATLGIGSFRENSATLSFGKRKEIRKIIGESALRLRYWDSEVNTGIRSSLFMGDILWNAGFNLMPLNTPAVIFPYAGLGVGLNTLRIRSESKTLSELLESTEPNAFIWQAAFLINVGAGADFKIAKKDARGGIVLGIRSGYLFDPFTKNRDWYSNGSEITDIPVLKQSGPYIQLIVGGWHNRN